jgi:hypothetical protein
MKRRTSSVKNFWVFRIAGMLAGIHGIRYEMTKKSDSNDVLAFAQCLHDAEQALNDANNLLRGIDHTLIVR